ncbi:MAG: ADP-ribosylation factor-like protein [Promethearchaeota archaeon]
MTRDVKLLITGIQAAGKTSILKVIDQDFVHLHQLKPTLAVERTMVSLLGMTFVRWDLGGQEKYRERYLEDMEKYFGGMNLLVYVIDIQEEEHERIEDTLSFFERILDFVRQKESKPVFTAVLFHKFDPDLIADTRLNLRMREYIERINSFKGEDYDIWFYPTSIFDRTTLLTVFSHVILQVYPRREIIEDELLKVRETMETPILCVADSTPFILGKVVRDGFPEKEQKKFLTSLIANVSILRSKPEKPEFHLDLFNPQVSLLLVPFEINDDTYYFAGLWDRLMFLNEEDVAAFKRRLDDNTLKIGKILEIFYG